jgi:hypothetical protein
VSSHREPGLEHLIGALTADGDPRELADRDAAAAMFRASFSAPAGPVPGRPRRWRPRLPFRSIRSAVAAGVIVIAAGTTAAAYAAVLPAPVQHIAHSVFASLGVPDARPSTAPSRAVPDDPSATATGSPTVSRPGHPAVPPRRAPADRSLTLTLTATSAQVAAGGPVLLKGRITYRGAAEPRIRVRLLERVAGQPDWRAAGTGVSGPGGYVTLTVRHLARNAAFRLAAHGASSPSATVTVVPRIVLRAVAGSPGVLRASARFGDRGDAVVLQRLSGGVWINVVRQRLNATHWTIFTVPAGSPAGSEFRAVLKTTKRHAAAVSDEVSPPRRGNAAKG